MFIYVTCGNKKKKINIHKYSSLYHLKELVKSEFNIKSNDTFYLTHNGFSLKDDSRPIDSMIVGGDNIDCSIKMKGGTSFIQVMLILILIVLVVFIIPVLLYSGFIPTILHITEIFIFKLLNFLACQVLRLRRFRNLRKLFGFIINATIYVVKCFYMFLSSYVMFFLVYFAWLAVFKGATDLFSMSSEYCSAIEQAKLMAQITAWTFVIIYALFKFPNIIYSSYAGILGLFGKFGLRVTLDTFFAADVIGKQIKTGVDKAKWSPWYGIPGFGQIFQAFYGTIQTGIDLIEAFLSRFVGYGCDRSVKKMNKVTHEDAKSFVNDFFKSKETEPEQDSSMDNTIAMKMGSKLKLPISSGTAKLMGKIGSKGGKGIGSALSGLGKGMQKGGNNEDLPNGYDKSVYEYATELAKYANAVLGPNPIKSESAQERVQGLSLDALDDYYGKIKKYIKENYEKTCDRNNLLSEIGDAHYIISLQREKCNLLGDMVGDCCTDEVFDYLKDNLKMMMDIPYISDKLKNYGVYNYVSLLTFALDTDRVNQAVEQFNNTFVLFKLFDANVIGVAAVFARILVCNIFYISRFTNNVMLNLGSPMDIADTLKCGFFAGTGASVVFYFALIYLPLTLTDLPVWAQILIAILIYIVFAIIKFYLPYFPIPLIPV